MVYASVSDNSKVQFYPKLKLSWNKPNKLFPTIAEIINTKATIAKRAPTSLMSYGALNKGFWSVI